MAQRHTVFGNIQDIENGENLIGATVFVEDKNLGISSNNYGFYSLTLPEGKYNISFSFIGYKTISCRVELTRDTTINIGLKSEITALNEVIVQAKDNSIVFNNQMGSHSLNLETIKLAPASVGEIDLIKNLQLLPGIQTTNEGTTNLSVRGGSFDQNLFLLDDAPIYNPSHALGFFSTFNPDAISSVKIYKTAFPAQYGGRLSSIIDIRMKEGNNQKLAGKCGMGLIASRLSLEGPIKKDQASFIISGRYSYAGLTANSLGSLGQAIGLHSLRDFNNHNEINFFDVNAKVNYKTKNNHFYLSAYTGKDHFYYFSIDKNSSMDWGNQTGTARWNHVFNSRIFSNTMIVYSKYDYSYILKDDARHFKWSSNLQEVDLKSDFDYFI
ncbi:MAG: carboxypeptidase-like regulatory domain-containing protein, partial [Bacteroidia bacterium]|nr:carboxypeptidase-like regulatory domain-containing protein [Bacteroidia bacterium]